MPTLSGAGYSTETCAFSIHWILHSETLQAPGEKQTVVKENRITVKLQVTHTNPQRNWDF